MNANYLVSNMLVTYAEPHFENDAAVYDIMRPSNRVEFERINPACSNPTYCRYSKYRKQ